MTGSPNSHQPFNRNQPAEVNRLESALEAAGVGTWEWDPVNRLLYWSAYCSALYGLSGEEPGPYDQIVNLIHADDRERVGQLVQRALQTSSGGPYTIQFRILRADNGEPRWLRCKGQAYFDEGGEPYRLLGTAEEVTGASEERGAVPEQTKESDLNDASSKSYLLNGIVGDTTAEDLLVTAFDKASIGMAFSDLEDKFLNANAAFANLLGYSEEELHTANYQHLIYPDQQGPDAKLLTELLAGQRPYLNLTHRYAQKDGTDRWIQLNITLIAGSTDKEGRLVTIARDVSSEVEKSQALATSEARFRSIVEQAPMAMGLLRSRDMVFEMGNQKFFDMAGEASAIGGEPLTAAFPKLGNQPLLEKLQGVYDTGEPFFGNGIPLRQVRQGQPEAHYFDFAVTPLRDTSGTITGVMLLAAEVTEQVIARKAIEASETKLRSVIATAPAAMGLFVGRDLIVEVPNQAFIDMVGKGPDVVGKPLREVMPELENQAFLQILDDVYTSGKMFQSFGTQVDIVQHGVMTHNFYNITYSPLFDEEGKVYAILDIAIDVTEAVKARQQLEESELFSRNIIDNSPVAKIVFVGEHMVAERVNQFMLTILGRDESIIGRPFLEAMPELIATPLMDRLQRVFRTGETYIGPEEKVEWMEHGQSHTGYYNYIYKALRNTDGMLYGVIVTATDVTAQVEARQLIAEAEASLRGAIELAELGTWSVNVASQIVTYNDRMQDWLGVPPGDHSLDDALQSIPQVDRERISWAMNWAMQTESGGIYEEEHLVENRQTGERRILHAQAKTFFDAGGQAYKIVGTSQDVTKQRHLQLALEQEVKRRTEELAVTNEELAATNEEIATANEELATTNDELAESNQLLTRSNQNLEQFAYVASHDLQEPLRKIQSFGDILKNQYASQLGEGINYLERMQVAAGRMSVLIKDLLTFSRISTQQDITGVVSLAEVINTVLSNLDLTIQEAEAVVNVDALPVVQGDKSQLGQLFQNLLTNALKFRQPAVRPEIYIRVRQVRSVNLPLSVRPTRAASVYYRIDVADNGIGFDDKYVDRIFQVFQRLHGKSQYAGTGIGLAICEKVVANHGGAITAISQPGQGATFCVYLPIVS